MNHEAHNGRSFGEILTDTKDELREFVETRMTMLRLEMNDRLKMLKAAAPLAVVGLVFLWTAFLMFSLALVGLIAAFLVGNPYQWAIAFGSIAVLWAMVGGVAAYLAKREFASKELMPKKTIGVLKQDKLWIQSEVRTQI